MDTAYGPPTDLEHFRHLIGLYGRCCTFGVAEIVTDCMLIILGSSRVRWENTRCREAVYEQCRGDRGREMVISATKKCGMPGYSAVGDLASV